MVLEHPAPEILTGLSALEPHASKQFLEALGVAVYTTDPRGVITSFNEAAADLWGRRPEIGKDMWCGSWKIYTIDGVLLPHDECPMGVTLKKGRPVRGVEAIAERPDGSRVWFKPYPTPLRDSSGRLIGAVNVLIDVTAQRAAERALRDREAQLKEQLTAAERLQTASAQRIDGANANAVYDAILDAAKAIMRSDMASMQLLDESKDALRLLAYRGFGPEFGEAFELCGGDIATACNAARRERRRVIVPDVEASDFLAPMLEVHRRFAIRAVQSTPLISRSGELLGMISTHWRAPHEPQESELRLLDVLARQAADLIERSRAEEVALHYTAIVASSDDAIVSKSLDGTIASWNAGAERIFGYTAEEAVGQSIRMIIPSDRQAEEDDVLARLRRGERIDHFETIRRRKDGTEVPISLTVSPVKDRYGRIIGASKVARDISERRQAERMVADALAVKDEFIGLVSHELRTPVTTIAGNAAILARRDNGLDEEARRQAIEDVRNEADRLNNIIENLLMLARLDRGGIEPEPVALSHVLRRAARDQQAVNGRAIRIGIDEGGESVIVAGDQGLLGHVIGNYLSNAGKYSPPDSPIDVIMDRIDGAARVRVLDRGIGIDASEAERLFESFYRSKNVGRVGGVGVGLSVCRRLIRAIDGECWARAREGGGSEFGFSVPLYEE